MQIAGGMHSLCLLADGGRLGPRDRYRAGGRCRCDGPAAADVGHSSCWSARSRASSSGATATSTARRTPLSVPLEGLRRPGRDRIAQPLQTLQPAVHPRGDGGRHQHDRREWPQTGRARISPPVRFHHACRPSHAGTSAPSPPAVLAGSDHSNAGSTGPCSTATDSSVLVHRAQSARPRSSNTGESCSTPKNAAPQSCR